MRHDILGFLSARERFSTESLANVLSRINSEGGYLSPSICFAGFTTAMPNSFKVELATAKHDFTATTGHVFKVALGKTSPTGTYGTATVNYSDLTGNSDELAASGGYSTGGFAWTAAQNITPTNTTTQTFWQWSVNPSWTSATFSTVGCIIYNSSASNKAAYVGSFGGTQTVTSGTFTLLQPTNGAGTSLLQLN